MRNAPVTRWSIARHALYGAAGAAVLWFGAAFFRLNPAFRPTLPFCIAFILCGAFVGAVSSYPDGLDTSNYVTRIECEFNLKVADEAGAKFAALGDLCAYISRQRHAQGFPLADAEIWKLVRRITSEEFGIKEGELQPETRYIDDLGC
jgi:hypothetical protein